MQTLPKIASTFAVLLALASCGGSEDDSPHNARFRLRPFPAGAEPVILEISDASAVANAQALLRTGQVLWFTGIVVRGDGGFNTPWHWHLDPATIEFAEITIEACQTTPTQLEQTIDYWVTFGRACILGSIEAKEP